MTQPEDIKIEESQKFFEETYKFLTARYGADNVVSAYVHMDETTPHMHFAFVPIAHDKKKDRLTVSAKKVIDKKELKVFHNDLDKHMEKFFGRRIGIFNDAVDFNGRTEAGNLTIDELKNLSSFTEPKSLKHFTEGGVFSKDKKSMVKMNEDDYLRWKDFTELHYRLASKYQDANFDLESINIDLLDENENLNSENENLHKTMQGNHEMFEYVKSRMRTAETLSNLNKQANERYKQVLDSLPELKKQYEQQSQWLDDAKRRKERQRAARENNGKVEIKLTGTVESTTFTVSAGFESTTYDIEDPAVIEKIRYEWGAIPQTAQKWVDNAKTQRKSVIDDIKEKQEEIKRAEQSQDDDGQRGGYHGRGRGGR
ncbi:Plasmid recombination enzyme [Bacteroidales bacterium Barb6]|nr:Plasmid recombination enzyme [Bacteroidales bacterium Barb6]